MNLIRITILKWLLLDLGRREGREDLRGFNWGETIILKYGMKNISNKRKIEKLNIPP